MQDFPRALLKQGSRPPRWHRHRLVENPIRCMALPRSHADDQSVPDVVVDVRRRVDLQSGVVLVGDQSDRGEELLSVEMKNLPFPAVF